MATRLGTVLTFKPGVTANEANKALRELAATGLLSEDWVASAPAGKIPALVPYRLEVFDDTEGGPVWYCP